MNIDVINEKAFINQVDTNTINIESNSELGDELDFQIINDLNEIKEDDNDIEKEFKLLNKFKNFNLNNEINNRKANHIKPIKLLNEESNSISVKDFENISFIKAFDSINLIIDYNEEKYECLIFPPKEYNEVDDFINDIINNSKDVKLNKNNFGIEFKYKTINKILKTNKKIDLQKYETMKNENKQLKIDYEKLNEKLEELKKYINEIKPKEKNENQNQEIEIPYRKKSQKSEKKINYLTVFPSGNIIIAAKEEIIIYSKDFKKNETLKTNYQKTFDYISVRDNNTFLSYSKDEKSILTWKKKENKKINFFFSKNNNKDSNKKEIEFISDENIKNENEEDDIIFISYLSNGDFISCSRNINDDDLQDKIKIWKSKKVAIHSHIESLLILDNKNKIISVGGNQIILWNVSLKFLDSIDDSINNYVEFIYLLSDNKFIVNDSNEKLNIYEILDSSLKFVDSISLQLNNNPLSNMIVLKNNLILIISNKLNKMKVYFNNEASNKYEEIEIEKKNPGIFNCCKLIDKEFILYDKDNIEVWKY